MVRNMKHCSLHAGCVSSKNRNETTPPGQEAQDGHIVSPKSLTQGQEIGLIGWIFSTIVPIFICLYHLWNPKHGSHVYNVTIAIDMLGNRECICPPGPWDIC